MKYIRIVCPDTNTTAPGLVDTNRKGAIGVGVVGSCLGHCPWCSKQFTTLNGMSLRDVRDGTYNFPVAIRPIKNGKES